MDCKHVAQDLIADPHITIRGLQANVMTKFHIKVIRTQCRNAKIKALYDLEGGLVEHYAKLRDYSHQILTSNPGSTVKLGVDDMSDGKTYFSRFYICFKALKEGWKVGCRKIVGIDGCYLRGVVQGELLSFIGRDANNQIYSIAWVVVCVENKDNWKWFLDLLMDDLDTEGGRGITLTSDPHKAAFSSLETDFFSTMEEIKELDPTTYTHLMEREPKTWSRAYQDETICCAAVENGVSESFNFVIVDAREKVIITMLEEIRIYDMQRLFLMKTEAIALEDEICLSIRKQLNLLQKSQRGWNVFQNSFEVRKGNEAYIV